MDGIALVLTAVATILLTTLATVRFAWTSAAADPYRRSGAPVAPTYFSSRPPAGYERGGFGNVQVGSVQAMGFTTSGSGSTGPVIVAGRAPTAIDELALGVKTMRSAGVAIGQAVDVVAQGSDRPPAKRIRMRVVGTVIVPPNPFQGITLGEGAAVSPEGYQRLSPASSEELPFLVRFVPGADRDAALASLSEDLKELPMTAALLIGLPIGAAAGRWGWTAFAGQLGVLPEPIVPLVPALIAVPASLVLANLIGMPFGRTAARTSAAAILRSE